MKVIGFVVLLAYILATVSDVGIVCFGADGHVALEQLRDAHPMVNDSTAISVSHAHAVSLVARDTPAPAMPHGPCFDLALDPSAQWQAGPKAEAPRVAAPLAAAVSAPAVVVPTANAPHRFVAIAEPAGDPVLTPLRSTVLRI